MVADGQPIILDLVDPAGINNILNKFDYELFVCKHFLHYPIVLLDRTFENDHERGRC